MAVDADSYGTIERLEAIVGDIVINSSSARTFSTSTIPTLIQAEGFIDDIAAELNTALINAGYVSPVVVGDDKAAFNYLRYANTCGAALLALDSLPVESYQGPDFTNIPVGRRGHCQNVYLAALKVIREEKLTATQVAGASHLGELAIGSSVNSDGDTKLPIFTRDVTDNPSSRNLTKA